MSYREDCLSALASSLVGRVGATIAAAYLVPPLPHRVELLAAAGPGADPVGPLGPVPSDVDAFVRSRTSAADEAGDRPATTPPAWRDHEQAVWLSVPVAAATAAVLAVAGPTLPDGDELRQAIVPLARLCIEPVPAT